MLPRRRLAAATYIRVVLRHAVLRRAIVTADRSGLTSRNLARVVGSPAVTPP